MILIKNLQWSVSLFPSFVLRDERKEKKIWNGSVIEQILNVCVKGSEDVRESIFGKPRAVWCYCFLWNQYLLNICFVSGSVLRAGGTRIVHEKSRKSYWLVREEVNGPVHHRDTVEFRKAASNPAKIGDVSPGLEASNMRLEGWVGVSQERGEWDESFGQSNHVQKPVVRDGVIKYVWSTGDARALRVGAGDVSTYTVNTMLILKGLLDHAKELGLFFGGHLESHGRVFCWAVI